MRVSDGPSLLDPKYILYRICTPQVFRKNILRYTNWSKFRSELGDKMNYHWFWIEGKEDLETVPAVLDTSPRESMNSSYPVKIVQERILGGLISWTLGTIFFCRQITIGSWIKKNLFLFLRGFSVTHRIFISNNGNFHEGKYVTPLFDIEGLKIFQRVLVLAGIGGLFTHVNLKLVNMLIARFSYPTLCAVNVGPEAAELLTFSSSNFRGWQTCEDGGGGFHCATLITYLRIRRVGTYSSTTRYHPPPPKKNKSFKTSTNLE